MFPVFCITNVSHSARGFHYIPYTHPPWPLLFICFPTQKMPQEEFCTLAVSNFSPPGSFEAIQTRFSLLLQRLLLRTQMTTTLRVAVIRSWTFCCLTVVFDTVNIYFMKFLLGSGTSFSCSLTSLAIPPQSFMTTSWIALLVDISYLSDRFQSSDIKNHLYTKNTYIFISNPALFPEYQMYV